MANPPNMSAIYPSLHAKTVLITGGAEGIGAATVELFCRQGSNVHFFDISTSSATTLITHITALRDTATGPFAALWTLPTFHHVNVTDLPLLQSTAEAIIAAQGKIDILINNAAAAGAASRVPTSAVTPASFQSDVDVNLRHVFFLTQTVVPAMLAQSSGAVINLGSITWRIPATGLPIYTASKAAIHGLTRSWAHEFGGRGVRVNSVMPGAIATERQRREVLTEGYRREVMGAQALQRDLEASEVAAVVGFLASGDAGGVAGSAYVVDGGWVGDP